MTCDINSLRHPKEKLYSSICLVVGALLWCLFALYGLFSIVLAGTAGFIVMAVYIGGIWLMSYFAKSLITAHMLGHYVKVGPQQFPHLQQMVEESAAAIGLNEAPQAVIYNSGGMMNAFALKLVGRRRYIWLTSALIDADSDEQVRFVIGHEMAHHAAGHLDGGKHFLRLPARMVPFLGSAYSRACELTCDRAGSLLAQDLSASRSALQMLACGSAKLNASMNPDAFQAQEQLVPPIAGFFIKIFATHPRTTRRVQALTEWYRGETTGVAVPLSASRA